MTQTFEPSLLRAHRADVVESMRSFVTPPETVCRTIIAYQLGLTGRDGAPCEVPAPNLIRATLCLWAVAACDGDMLAARPIAVSVELIDAFVRLHDDIQHDRRANGARETVPSVWGLGQAVNGGDAMHSLALSILSQGTLEPSLVLRTFERVVRAVHESMDGNVRALAAQNTSLRPRQSFQIAVRQTGALIGAALEAGAIAAGAPELTVSGFRHAGRLLGVALHLREVRDTGRVPLAGIDARLARRCAVRACRLIAGCGVIGTRLAQFEEIADYTTSWT